MPTAGHPATAAHCDPYGAFLPSTPFGGAQTGPLAGVRLCVKDNVRVAGQPWTGGHPLFAARTASETAPAVAALLEAGAHFVGMTATDAGGFGMTTDTVANPLYPNLTVGGSSGGAAAAVAAGLADLAVGTDTGGSIRVPAACTGLFGFKPTRGRVPLTDILPLAPSFDHPGLLARRFDHLTRAAGVWLADAGIGEAHTRTLSIAVERDAPAFADPAIRERVSKVLARLRESGASIQCVALPEREAVVADFGAKVVWEARPHYADLTQDQMLHLGAAARKALALPALDAAAQDAAEARLAAAARVYDACLDAFDLIFSPTLFIPPPPRGVHVMEIDGRRRGVLAMLLAGTCFANLMGGPALSLPLPASPPHPSPLPFALHLAARRGADGALLQSARRILDVCTESQV